MLSCRLFIRNFYKSPYRSAYFIILFACINFNSSFYQ
nr:MAG TPA: Macoilin family [Caudoviricetes sp.]DAS51592.1 MAG TPA: Macoilin family [Caudoviricetes sp.]